MGDSMDTRVTQILHGADADREGAAAALFPLLYEQLRALAEQRMAAERSDHTLSATALVHEAYLRLVGASELSWTSKAHFFAAAAQAMRRILIEHARAKGREKRGGKLERLPLDVIDLAEDCDPQTILAVDEAVSKLEAESPDVAAVVKLRFFAGLSIEETASALGVSERSVNRDWSYARAWLFRVLGREES